MCHTRPTGRARIECCLVETLFARLRSRVCWPRLSFRDGMNDDDNDEGCALYYFLAAASLLVCIRLCAAPSGRAKKVPLAFYDSPNGFFLRPGERHSGGNAACKRPGIMSS